MTPTLSVDAAHVRAADPGDVETVRPEGAVGFTTIELKTNFLATALDGTLHAESRRVHGGRTTQVWDATVSAEEGKTLALFRCTQLLLY